MKKMITLLFSFALIFVGSLSAGDDVQVIRRENNNVSLEICSDRNLNDEDLYVNIKIKNFLSKVHTSSKRIDNDKPARRYSSSLYRKNISAKKYQSIEEEAACLLQPGYCETVYFLGNVSKSTLVRPGKMNDEYSSEGQCLQALSEYLAAQNASGQARK